jgi:hypothetical protein
VTNGAETSQFIDRRWGARADVAIAGGLRERGRGGLPIALRNLSRRGCRARLDGAVICGDYVWVRLPTLAGLPGRIAWQEDAEAGIEFHAPLHEAVAAMLVARAQAPASKKR